MSSEKNSIKNKLHDNLLLSLTVILLIALIIITIFEYYFKFIPLDDFNGRILSGFPLIFSLVIIIFLTITDIKDKFYDLILLRFNFKKNLSKKFIENNIFLLIMSLIIYVLIILYLPKISAINLLTLSVSLISFGLSLSILSFYFMDSKYIDSKKQMFESAKVFSIATLVLIYTLIWIAIIKIFLIPIPAIESYNISLIDFIIKSLKRIFYIFLTIIASLSLQKFIFYSYVGLKLFLKELIAFPFQNKEK